MLERSPAWKSMIRNRWQLARLLLALLIGLALLPASGGQAQAPRRNVLLLHSYHHGLSWTDNITQSVLAVLDPEARALEVYIEYMDAKRLGANAAYYQQLAAVYAMKYSALKFDVILVADNNAFNFMLEYHDTLFPGVPVVFCGINFFEDSMLAGIRNMYTGVVEDVDMPDTLDLMLRLHPNTREIIVINDATTTGKVYSTIFAQLRPTYEAQGVQFRMYEDPDLTELLPALEALGEGQLVLMILFNRDRAGQFFTYEQSIDLVRAHTTAPIYGLWDFYMGRGLVGGKLTNAVSQGQAAGQLAVRVLEGEPVGEIPILKDSPNRYMFDYRELQAYGLDLASLPAGSEISYRPPTFFDRYRGLLIGGVGGLLLAAGIIIFQLFNLRRRRQIEQALRQSNVELEQVRVSLEQRVEERTKDLARRSQQLAAASTVAREAAAIRDIDRLLTSVVGFISDQFGFYHAGIFLVDDAGEYAVLRAVSSVGGQQMLARGHRLKIGTGIVGSVLQTGRPRIALDVGEDAVWFNNPDLPNTRSELGLPLTLRDTVFGVLDVQSTEPEAFSESDIATLQTMAEQIALAIDNARLFGASQQALEEVQRVVGQQTREAWEQILARRPAAFRYSGAGVVSLIHESGTRSPEAGQDASRRLVAEIALRDQVLAALELERDADKAPWTAEEVELVQTLAAQAALALDNARLFEEAQRRAARQQLVREIIDNIRAATTVEDAVERTLSELQRALRAAEVAARIGVTAPGAAGVEERQ